MNVLRRVLRWLTRYRSFLTIEMHSGKKFTHHRERLVWQRKEKCTGVEPDKNKGGTEC